MARASLVTVGEGRHRFTCWVCHGNLFSDREVKINTTGAEFFDLGWANASATGLTCQGCGYLHTFVYGVEFWEPEGGYPAEQQPGGTGVQPGDLGGS